MSKLLFLPLLILMSCSQEAPGPEGDSVDREMDFSPVTNIEDNERIQLICRSLLNKQNVLNVLVSTGQEYLFEYSQKNCADSSMPESRYVVTTLNSSSEGYTFRTKNGEHFGFKDVETYSSGVLSEICRDPSASPIRTGSNSAVWWTTFVDSRNCQPGAGSLCVHLQRGSSEDGSKFRIHTNEWIKFKLSDVREGFFLERKLISSAGCQKGRTLEMKAVLK